MDARQQAAVVARESHPDAVVVWLTGSAAHGTMGPRSDLDLIVLYPQLDRAWRSAFRHGDTPVEAFVHDPRTMRGVFERERAAGHATLATMVADGVQVAGNDPALAATAQRFAAALIAEGPPPLGDAELDWRRFAVGEQLDDLLDAAGQRQRIAVAPALHRALADLALRTAGAWSGVGKHLNTQLHRVRPDLARALDDALVLALAADGDPQSLADAATEVLDTVGGPATGPLRQDAPADWADARGFDGV